MRHKPGCGRYYFAHGAVERLAYFGYILSAESINQRSFLPATHGTRFALHRSVERVQNLLMFAFCHVKNSIRRRTKSLFGFAVRMRLMPLDPGR
jgi:hypothetical protein